MDDMFANYIVYHVTSVETVSVLRSLTFSWQNFHKRLEQAQPCLGFVWVSQGRVVNVDPPSGQCHTKLNHLQHKTKHLTGL